jgi:pyrrolysine biosynthesis protein PylD
MTRLTPHDIDDLHGDLDHCDADLIEKTGCSLRSLACRAVGFSEHAFLKAAETSSIAVVPVTAGMGVITGFCEAVAAIVSHLGCKAFVTRASDVAGLAEAAENKANAIILADDQFFVVIHHGRHWHMENSKATALGFVTGLTLMTGNRQNRQNVLLIGCGRVGQQAVEALCAHGYNIDIYDINTDSYEYLFKVIDEKYHARIRQVTHLNDALLSHRLIVDASPAADLIHAEHIFPDTYISAPGIPLGLDVDARKKIGTRLMHDPLQTGVAVMTAGAMRACHTPLL